MPPKSGKPKKGNPRKVNPDDPRGRYSQIPKQDKIQPQQDPQGPENQQNSSGDGQRFSQADQRDRAANIQWKTARESAENHYKSDVDSNRLAQHHTLGLSPNQASQGDHNHNGVNSNTLSIHNLTGQLDFTDITGNLDFNRMAGECQPYQIDELNNGWQAYTPAWTSTGAAPSINNGSINGLFLKFGPLSFVTIKVVMGSTTNYGSGSYAFSLPGGHDVRDGPGWMLTGYILNGGAPNFFPANFWVSPTTNLISGGIASSGKTEGVALLGSGGHKAAWATNNEIFISGYVGIWY